MNRVVVTGLGAVSSLGLDLATSWSKLLQGSDAAAPVTLFDVSGSRARQAAQAVLPELPTLTGKQISRLSRASRLALPAASEALASAGLLNAAGHSTEKQLELVVSTTAGGMALGEAFVRRNLQPSSSHRQELFEPARYQPQNQIADLQRHLGFAGSSLIIANACASGANAIGHAHDLIRSGLSQRILTGGFEALTELLFWGFDCLQALTIEKCRPFDQNRSGLMLGEAAAFLVLESETEARRRHAPILAELVGYGHSTDTHHLTQPHPEGCALVAALCEACPPERKAEIGYINGHGTGTPLNDIAEAKALAQFFGETIPPLSSTKAALGHTLGAAGAIEACFTIQALRTGQLPPQLNLQTPEPLVAQALVSPSASPRSFPQALSVNLGFGGSNAALLFSQYENGR
jgi:3-oxoacyl-[acyl-carrier-protein] synthase II